MSTKTEQIQIRVTPAQKLKLKHQAARAGQDLSAYVLARALPAEKIRFTEILLGLSADLAGDGSERRHWLAELNDLLADLAPFEFREAVEQAELQNLSPYLRNYVAAMVEQGAHQKGVAPPVWAGRVRPLDEPYFVARLSSLRPYLLSASPVAFKRRNIFVDSGVGDRV